MTAAHVPRVGPGPFSGPRGFGNGAVAADNPNDVGRLVSIFHDQGVGDAAQERRAEHHRRDE